ncbi:hypothetical protein RHMOL_Rhmol04G0244200 [Rhododendron molle]|uniref:Uncharacterized protein n=1 Tax=Rhododendron molle TaxID=49168 RepID=A0ACC0P4A1_RHOML|nr:hypothetical protein RHMOL_Rhmol04G0244200 [Rhododendron molle]
MHEMTLLAISKVFFAIWVSSTGELMALICRRWIGTSFFISHDEVVEDDVEELEGNPNPVVDDVEADTVDTVRNNKRKRKLPPLVPKPKKEPGKNSNLMSGITSTEF